MMEQRVEFVVVIFRIDSNSFDIIRLPGLSRFRLETYFLVSE